MVLLLLLLLLNLGIHSTNINQVPYISACDAGDPGSIPGSEDPLEEGMATHSSILAWRILQTEEPGRLQSMDTT